uniref:Large ribosomal subunit protein bL21c n=1 Tax=Jubula hutchinsiae TaxID=203687 RepID=A0A4Y5P689_9MARC|nr:ribosomal protein L21 [Jubula hutchinsiae]QCW58797.1 ribosomal protein L21 [Jubula hutchinsiae]
MNTYAVIEIGGQQLRVEPGRFYNIRHFASIKPTNLKQNTKILIYRVLMIRRESDINIGHPWVKGGIVRGRILHPCLEKKITIYKMIAKKKIRRKLGHRQKSTRFLVDSIFFNEQEIN